MRRSTLAGGLCAALLVGAWPAVAVPPGEFHEVTTTQEIADFYQQNPEVKKVQEKYEVDVKKRKDEGLDQPMQRGLDAALDEDVQNENARLAAADPDSYMRDLKAEYLEEKGQLAEETIWSAAEEKATPEVRQLYRDYLRRVYFQGHGFDAGSTRCVAKIRSMIDERGGYHGFPSEDMGENPPGAAGTYGGWHVRMTTGVLDICVHSHEWFHWCDDWHGGVDGDEDRDRGGPETFAYGHMCREL